jgi:hypothetical protein
VDSVLLGLAGLDELGVDAELDEPDGKGGETGKGAGGEGDTVVGADAIRQPVLLKKHCEVLLGPLEGDGWVGIDAEEKPRSEIADREWEAVLTVLEAELALVVGRPDVVGAVRNGLGAAWVGAAEAALGAGQALASQDAADGGGRGELPGRVAALEEVEELASPQEG